MKKKAVKTALLEFLDEFRMITFSYWFLIILDLLNIFKIPSSLMIFVKIKKKGSKNCPF